MKTTIMKIKFPTCLLALLLLMAGCQKDSGFYKFLVQSEAPASEDGSKAVLVNESLVYWQDGDAIDAWRIGGNSEGVKLIFHGAGEPVALFEPESENSSMGGSGNTFLTLFPHNDTNAFNGGSPTIYFSANQEYIGDNTFGVKACPMVAYGGEDYGDNVVRMLFHNLCGIVRIQLRNAASTASDVTLQNIQFTSNSGNLPLSGSFVVQDFNKYNPYVVPASGGTSNTVTINNINRKIGNDLLTFYLVLPAGQGTTQYGLTMLVRAVSGSDQLYISKQFSVGIRRNGITKMPSLTIDSWSRDESGMGGTTSIGLSGNGTPSRPFLIYTVDDLLKVRYAFNNTMPINGVYVNSNPCTFKVMRSDIVLTGSQWDRGIVNFNGTMIYSANQTGSPGIKNNTKVPIFESIGENGVVENVSVWGSYEWTDNDGTPFSPLCNVNNGKIVNCRVSDNASYVMTTSSSSDVGMAGICVTNHGLISGCGCRATLVAPSVAGICWESSGTGAEIVACYTSSPMQVVHGNNHAVRAAGICYKNSALVKDCYVASNINAPTATDWGGIVYQNYGNGMVKHCYVDASGIIQSTASIGGIVHTMTSGTVDNCWNDADLMNVQGGTGGLGGIVYSMQDGEVRNCIRYRPTGSITCTGGGVVGGVVARMSGGAVRNSAFYGDLSQSTVTVKGAFAGTLSGGDIENVYALQALLLGPRTQFYGTRNGSVSFNNCFGQIEVGNDVSVVANESLSSELNDHSWSQGLARYVYLQWDNEAPPMLTSIPFVSKRRR